MPSILSQKDATPKLGSRAEGKQIIGQLMIAGQLDKVVAGMAHRQLREENLLLRILSMIIDIGAMIGVNLLSIYFYILMR